MIVSQGRINLLARVLETFGSVSRYLSKQLPDPPLSVGRRCCAPELRSQSPRPPSLERCQEQSLSPFRARDFSRAAPIGSHVHHVKLSGRLIKKKKKSKMKQLKSIFIYLFLVFVSFQGRTCSTWTVPSQGSSQSCSCWPTPQPQQHRIQAASVAYTTVHSNARSLTH